MSCSMRSLLLAATLASLAHVHAKYPTHEELEQLYGKPKPRALHLKPVLNASQSLRDAARARGIFLGASLKSGPLSNASDVHYRKIAAEQFSLTTAGTECKWPATEAQQGVYSLEACNTIAQFAVNSTMAHRLHNLAWGVDNPSWVLAQGFTPSQLQGFLTDHVTKLVTSYAPGSALPAYCTDVVNEAVASDGSSLYKTSPPWYPALGANYLPIAFHAARAANKDIKLFYNDFGGEGNGTKSDKIYNMLKDMLAQGVPIDGVGLQMHVSVDSYPAPEDVSANIARLVALGLEVHITEMDVRCPWVSGQMCGMDRLNLQASIYGGMLEACLNNTAATAPSGKGGCKSLEMWGFTDLYTWIWEEKNPTHLNEQPLPYDMSYNPKPAYYQLLATLQNA